jgi:hypothetical protein
MTVCSSRFDLGSKTEVQVEVGELWFDDAYLSKVIDDNKSCSMQIEVLELISNQFFFTANITGRKPTTLLFFQPPTPQK